MNAPCLKDLFESAAAIDGISLLFHSAADAFSERGRATISSQTAMTSPRKGLHSLLRMALDILWEENYWWTFEKERFPRCPGDR